jgi:uncharacterized membrane protein
MAWGRNALIEALQFRLPRGLRRKARSRRGRRSAWRGASRLRSLVGIQPLEERLMLAIDTGIVVGRTLSAWSVADVQDNHLKITYAVYNQEATDISGVLLTTTLAPGITFESATQLPDRNGQNLAWSLGTLGPFGRASVEVTVVLAAATPLTLDDGAEAFGTLLARAVTDEAPAAALHAAPIDAALLASTPDANTTDPIIQEKAAALDYDPQRIIGFLQNDVAYESYRGSLRGARGALWSSAGNALDEASLGIALLRASGIPARYAAGTLSDSLTKQLILSMFPASFQVVGFVPPGTEVADPANDPRLLAETRQHYWIQVDAGAGLQDIDTIFASGTIGQPLTAVEGTFAEVPDALRHHVDVRLNVEIFSHASAAFGVGGFGTTTVLEKSFNTVELVGRPMTIGHAVDTSGIGAPIFSSRTNTYSPYISVGDEALDTSMDHLLFFEGSYQEVITNFPFGSQVLTGVFLEMDISGPGMATETLERALLDRIGYAARRAGAGVNVSVDPSAQPAFSVQDAFTIHVQPGRQDPRSVVRLQREVETLTREIQATEGTGIDTRTQGFAFHNLLVAQTRMIGAGFLATSDAMVDYLAESAKVKAYHDKPRVVIVSIRLGTSDETGETTLTYSIDLRSNSIRAVPFPGQANDAVINFNVARGLVDGHIESTVIPAGAMQGGANVITPISAEHVFSAAIEQGIGFALIKFDTLTELDALPLSLDAKARITAAVQEGREVIVPRQEVLVGEDSTTAWYELNPDTGELDSVLENGDHGLVTGIVVGLIVITIGILLLYPVLGLVAGIGGGGVFLLCLPFFPHNTATCVDYARNVVNVFKNTLPHIPYLYDLFKWAVHMVLFALQPPIDPPVVPFLVGLDRKLIKPQNREMSATTTSATRTSGSVTANLSAKNLEVSGNVSATWTNAAESNWAVQTLNADNATVRNANGAIVGVGVVGLTSTTAVGVSLDAQATVDVNGQGVLSFYPESGDLGASGAWDDYSATLTGPLRLRVNSDSITLNGALLPAGSYTISGAAATLSGSDLRTAPNFANAVSIEANEAVVQVGQSTGTATLAGAPFAASNGFTFTGFEGVLNLSAGADADSVNLNGIADHVLRMAASATNLTTDQNTPISFRPIFDTSLGGEYDFGVDAPEGWAVTIGDDGTVTVVPALGLQSGAHTIRVNARSQSTPGLVAQAEIQVVVESTLPGIDLTVDLDTVYSVPVGGAELPTAYMATVHNFGPTAQTIDLTFPAVSAGFTLVPSATQITVPAGEAGIVGVYLIPNSSLPAPATPASFAVMASSATDPSLTATEIESFAVPAVRGVTLTVDQSTTSTTPGAAATVQLTVTNVGNVALADAGLIASASPGLAVGGLTPTPLAEGQSKTLTLTLTPSAATPLNSTLSTTITATLGQADLPFPSRVDLDLRVAVPGADAIADAATAADQLGNADLADRLNDVSIALTNLVQEPTNPVFKSQSLASVDSVTGLMAVDPLLAGFVAPLAAARDQLAAATTGPQIAAAVNNLGNALDDFATTVTTLAASNFEIFLTPNSQAAVPLVPREFGVVVQNIGTESSTYNVAVSGLPAGITAQFSAPSATLAPGAFANLTLTLTQTTTNELLAFDFSVDVSIAGATPAIVKSAVGTLETRNEFVSVVSVDADLPFVDPGESVDISARVLNAVNRVQQARARYEVRNPAGSVVFTSAPVDVTLGVVTSLATIDLGSFDTTGRPLGQYTIHVALTDLAGNPIPGGVGQGSLLIGSPVTASLDVSPAVLPPGTSVVTNTLVIENQTTLVGPLGVLSQTELPGAWGVVKHSHYVYASGTSGIRVFDVADPSNPQLIRTFGSSATTLEIRGDKLFAISFGGPFGRFPLAIYSLADPEDPQFLGNATHNDVEGIPYSLAWNMVVTDTHAFVSTWSNTVLLGGQNDIKFQTGDVLAIDVSDPTAPVFVSALLNTYGTNNDGIGQFLNADNSGGDGNLWEIVQVDANTLLVAGSTAKGDDTQTGSGVVHVIDISDPADMMIVRTLAIPGTVQAVGLSIEGNRAFVAGSQGGWSDPANPNDFTGNLVLATLDISDPRNPALIHSEVLDRSSVGPFSLRTTPLGNGLFVFSSQGNSQEQPSIFVVDANNAERLVTSGTTVPAATANLDGTGNFLYATDQRGLIIYQIDAPDAVPVIARVQVPTNTGVAIVPGSFNIEPTSVIAGADFDTLVFDLTFTAGHPSETITWQSIVTGLQPGASRAVTLESIVEFVSQGTPGELSLPAREVFAEQVLGLTPATRTVQPGATAAYSVTIENPAATSVTYSLAVEGVPAGWAAIASQATVPAGGSINVPLTLVSDPFAAQVEYGFTVTATTGGVASSVTGSLFLEGEPVLPTADPESHGVVASLTPANAMAGPGTAADFVVRVTNTGSATDTFALSLNLPTGFAAILAENTIEIPPGASNFRDVRLRIVPPLTASAGNYNFTVVASSANHQGTTASAAGSVLVLNLGVDVDITQASGSPGGILQMVVRNTGRVAETFDLSLAGPAALVGTLGLSSVTLAPGAAQTVPITVGAVDFAFPGALSIMGVAKSRLQPAVADADEADIMIAPFAGLAAFFDPDEVTLPAPGQTSLLLFVENLGNHEEQYSATIVTTTGPLTASLRGPDGLPTQSVPLFILPGLSTGVLVVDASLGQEGVGAVTVAITPLDGNPAAVQATATIQVGTPATGSISGLSYVDVNNNGRYAPPEHLILGTEILLKQNGAVVARTFSNSFGEFRFTGLPAGTYVVQKVQPTLYFDGADTAGSLGDQDAIANQVTITLGAGISATGYLFAERGLLPQYIGKSMYLTSTPTKQWQNLDLAATALWYAFETVETHLDVSLAYDPAGGAASVEFFDAAMQSVSPQQTSTGGDHRQFIVAAGGVHYLRLSGDNRDIDLTLALSTPNADFDSNGQVDGAADLPGDYSGNGGVDAADYVIWRKALGSNSDLRANGDNTGPSAGVIDQADYAVWRANFGNTSPRAAAAASVDEPARIIAPTTDDGIEPDWSPQAVAAAVSWSESSAKRPTRPAPPINSSRPQPRNSWELALLSVLDAGQTTTAATEDGFSAPIDDESLSDQSDDYLLAVDAHFATNSLFSVSTGCQLPI